MLDLTISAVVSLTMLSKLCCLLLPELNSSPQPFQLLENFHRVWYLSGHRYGHDPVVMAGSIRPGTAARPLSGVEEKDSSM